MSGKVISFVLLASVILGSLLACPGPETIDDAAVVDAGKDANMPDARTADLFRPDNFVDDSNVADGRIDDVIVTDNAIDDVTQDDRVSFDVQQQDLESVDSSANDAELVDVQVMDNSAASDTQQNDQSSADVVNDDIQAQDVETHDVEPDDVERADQFVDAQVNDSTVADTVVVDTLSVDAHVVCNFPQMAADGVCRNIRVLVLDDGAVPNSGIVAALTTAGFVVSDGGLFYQWDGMTPSLDTIDTVLILQGTDYDNELLPAANTVLTAFVSNGGGLVRTEWVAWVGTENTVNALLPVDFSLSYGDSPTWTVNDVTHPLARNITNGFVSQAGYTLTSLRQGAVAVIEDQFGYPIVSYTQSHGGTVVHLNHDVTFTVSPMETMAQTLYLNAVYFSALR